MFLAYCTSLPMKFDVDISYSCYVPDKIQVWKITKGNNSLFLEKSYGSCAQHFSSRSIYQRCFKSIPLIVFLCFAWDKIQVWKIIKGKDKIMSDGPTDRRTDKAVAFCYKKLFQEYHYHVKPFGPRSGPVFSRTWSGCKLFAKVISRRYYQRDKQ